MQIEVTRMRSDGGIETVPVSVLPDGRMTPSDAAKYCGYGPQTFANKRRDGTGPRFVKRGKVWYFKDDLDDWLRNGRVSSTAQARALKHLPEDTQDEESRLRGGRVSSTAQARAIAVRAAEASPVPTVSEAEVEARAAEVPRAVAEGSRNNPARP